MFIIPVEVAEGDRRELNLIAVNFVDLGRSEVKVVCYHASVDLIRHITEAT